MLLGTVFYAAGLLSLFYPKFVSRGKTSLAGDVPVGLAGECLCHPRVLHASELIRIPRPAIMLKPNKYKNILGLEKFCGGLTMMHYEEFNCRTKSAPDSVFECSSRRI